MMNEIKDLYLKLLQRKYQRTIKSIPEYKLQELLDYAQNVNNYAQIKLNCLLDPDSQPYLDPEAPYNWPYPIIPEVKTEYRLKDYLTTSGIIIRLLENYFKKPDITLPEQALIKHYNGEIFKKDGSKLYGLWAKYHKRVNRLGTEDTELKNKNKIELFEKVIEKLSGEQKIQAEKDLKQLKINIDNQNFIK